MLANPPEWIEKLRPQVVLHSVASGDREGRPSPETLEAVRGYTRLRTDHNRWIHLSTDGERIWVENVDFYHKVGIITNTNTILIFRYIW